LALSVCLSELEKDLETDCCSRTQELFSIARKVFCWAVALAFEFNSAVFALFSSLDRNFYCAGFKNCDVALGFFLLPRDAGSESFVADIDADFLTLFHSRIGW